MFTPGPDGQPSPLPVLTLLLGAAVLAALGIIVVARSSAPAVGWVLLVAGALGAGWGVALALRNVRAARAAERAARAGRDGGRGAGD